jgi:predicted house-cleaning NTP pyrophosphatase (Maf/HAM1 superfamily)
VTKRHVIFREIKTNTLILNDFVSADFDTKTVDKPRNRRSSGRVLNGSERKSTVYLSDFVTFEGDRFYVSANMKTGKIRLERISNEALERFIRNVLSMGEDRTIPAGKKGMSA